MTPTCIPVRQVLVEVWLILEKLIHVGYICSAPVADGIPVPKVGLTVVGVSSTCKVTGDC